MKAVAIAVSQLALALTVVLVGVAVLALPDDLSRQLARLGLGEGARMAAGSLQVLAGLCLIVPRGHIAGAAILATMTAGLAVFAVVQTAGEASAQRGMPRLETAGLCQAVPAVVARSEWGI